MNNILVIVFEVRDIILRCIISHRILSSGDFIPQVRSLVKN
jgi:hypothetical protein